MRWSRAETRFRLSAKRTSPFKSARASVQSTTGSRGVRISGSSAGYTIFRGSVKSTGYPLHSPGSPSIPLPCVTVCHHISAGLYYCAIAESTVQGTKLEDSTPLISQPATGVVHIPATYFSKIQFDVIQTSHSQYSD
jgi:hypothetical protein